MPTNECHKCGNFIEFPEHGLGEHIRCPHCGTPVLLTNSSKTLPAPPPVPEPAAESKAADLALPAESVGGDLAALAGLREPSTPDPAARARRRRRRRIRRRVRRLAYVLVPLVLLGTTYFLVKRHEYRPPTEAEHKAAVNQLAEDAAAAGLPQGFLGTKWLMSMKEVAKIAPNAKQAAPGVLIESRTVYDRPASVSYHFRNDLLLLIKVTFPKPGSPADFEQTQTRLTAEYGRMSRPAPAPGYALSSQKKLSHFVVQHLLPDTGAGATEQVLLYVRGGGNPSTMPDVPKRGG